MCLIHCSNRAPTCPIYSVPKIVRTPKSGFKSAFKRDDLIMLLAEIRVGNW